MPLARVVEPMRHLGLEVKSAAQEQCLESSLIPQTVEVVAARIKARNQSGEGSGPSSRASSAASGALSSGP
jgi:hypothetical protein